MIYEFQCDACKYNFEVVKSMKEAGNAETCPHCDAPNSRRIYSPPLAIHGASVKDAYFDLSLGQVVKNGNHLKQICKEKGLIDVGTETKESFHKHTVEKRQKEKEKEWSEL